MDKNNGFPKKDRLCGNKRIGEMFEKGRSGFVYPFRYLYYDRTSAEDVSVDAVFDGDMKKEVSGGMAVLITVSKRYHKRANKRNLLKRRTREAYRTGNAALKEITAEKGVSMSLGLIYSTKEVLDYKVIDNAVRKIISEIVKSV